MNSSEHRRYRTTRKEARDHRTGHERRRRAARSGPGGDVPRSAAGPGLVAEHPGLGFTVASAVAHEAEGPLWYDVDLTADPGDDGAFELWVKPDTGPERLLVSMRTAAALCAMAVDGSPASARGFHPAGPADPSGFAAMACDEILGHITTRAEDWGRASALIRGSRNGCSRRLFPWLGPGAGPSSGPGAGPRPRCCGPTGGSICLAGRVRRAGAGTARPWPSGTASFLPPPRPRYELRRPRYELRRPRYELRRPRYEPRRPRYEPRRPRYELRRPCPCPRARCVPCSGQARLSTRGAVQPMLFG